MNGRVTACVRPPHFLPTCIILLAVLLCYNTAGSQGEDLTVPVIADGQTQEIPQFKDPDFWIRHDLWVETEFDSDGDGKLDRMHVDVTRPRQTESEGLKLPVIYISSPYFGRTGSTAKEFFGGGPTGSWR